MISFQPMRIYDLEIVGEVLYPHRCGEQETLEHMLLECNLIARTWRASDLGLDFDPRNRKSLADWFSLWESMAKEETLILSAIIKMW